MTREELDRKMQWMIPDEESARNLNNEDGSHFVVVNLSQQFMGAGFYVCSEDGDVHTHHTLKDATELVAQLLDEFDHTIESARIFKLEPVPLDEVAEMLRRVVDDEGCIELETEEGSDRDEALSNHWDQREHYKEEM